MRRRLPWITAVLLACEGVAPKTEPVPAREPAIAAPAALQAAIAAGVRRLGENEARFEVDAFVAALAVEELAGGGGGLRVEPELAGGAMAGYRVAEVAPGSAYALLGLRAGDVIEAIGEVRLDSPERAAALVGALGRGGTLAVVRDGVGFTVEVRVAGGVSWAELLRRRTGTPGQVVANSALGTGAIAQAQEDMAPEQGSGVQVGGDSPPPAERPGAAATPQAGGGTQTGASGGTKAGTSSGTKAGASGGSASGTKAGASGGSAGGTGSAGATGVQCASAASCTLERKVFDAAVADPSKLERQASIAPAKNGYKLTRVTPGSTVAALGFRAGDVIVSVNGARLDDDVAALGLYMGLASTRNYTVVYERGGARATKSIALR